MSILSKELASALTAWSTLTPRWSWMAFPALSLSSSNSLSSSRHTQMADFNLLSVSNWSQRKKSTMKYKVGLKLNKYGNFCFWYEGDILQMQLNSLISLTCVCLFLVFTASDLDDVLPARKTGHNWAESPAMKHASFKERRVRRHLCTLQLTKGWSACLPTLVI